MGLCSACSEHGAVRPDETRGPVGAVEPIGLSPVPLEGDCSLGPEMGALGAYSGLTVELLPTDSGWSRVRSCAVWPASDLSNVIGEIPSGVRVPAFGPVKHPAFSAGLGYIIPLQDGDGTTCRGYVSATITGDEVRGDEPSDASSLPLPDASPAWRGPCLVGE